jgi:hypothetical protein
MSSLESCCRDSLPIFFGMRGCSCCGCLLLQCLVSSISLLLFRLTTWLVDLTKRNLHELSYWHWRRLTLSIWRCWRFHIDVDGIIMTTWTIILSRIISDQPSYGSRYKNRSLVLISFCLFHQHCCNHYYCLFFNFISCSTPSMMLHHITVLCSRSCSSEEHAGRCC